MKIYQSHFLQTSIITLCLLLLSACGGGSSSGNNNGANGNNTSNNSTSFPLSTTKLIFSDYAQSQSLTFISNENWQLSGLPESPEWLSVNKSTGSGSISDQSLSFTVTANNRSDHRIATITLNAGKAKATLTINQQGRPSITSISPDIIEGNSTAQFTVTGTGLQDSFKAQIEDVTISQLQVNEAGTQLTFIGEANDQAGQKNGVIKRDSSAIDCSTQADHTACLLKEFQIQITEASAITLSTTQLNFSDYAENQSLTFKSNKNWQLSTLPDWLSVNNSTGNESINNQSLSFTVTTNSLSTHRTATITLNAGKAKATLTINQQGRPNITDISPKIIEVNSTAQFTITGTRLQSTFNVSIDDVTVSQLQVNEAGTQLTFIGEANNQAGQKKGVIKRYSSGEDCISQVNHAVCPLNATFSIQITPVSAVTLSTTQLSFSAYTENQSLTFKSNKNWQLSTLPDWLSVNNSTGSESISSQNLSFTAETSSQSISRIATIILNAGNAKATLTINQQGRPNIISISPDIIEGNSTVQFTVIGTGLADTFKAQIEDVTISQLEVNEEGTELTFMGRSNHDVGQKKGVIKRKNSAVDCAIQTDHSACPLNSTFSMTLTTSTFTTQLEKAIIDNAKVTLMWSASTNATAYHLHQAKESFGDIAVVNYSTLEGYQSYLITDTTKTITGLVNNSTYHFVVVSIKDNQESLPSNEVIVAPFVRMLNDTGITFGGNSTSGNQSGTDCSPTGFTDNTEQDCHQGRDAEAVTDTLSKVGGGQAGFDFSKLGSNGNVLSIQNAAWSDSGSESAGTTWSCVQDNHTGLIWEVKTTDGGLHDKGDTYSWYSTDYSTNGGVEGTNAFNKEICKDYQSGKAATYCNTQAFVARVNQVTLCGANDWRVPTLEELLSIAHLGRFNPSIDTDYFPNTKESGKFWTSLPSFSDSNNYAWAWELSFFDGYGHPARRGSNNHLRLVRSSQ